MGQPEVYASPPTIAESFFVQGSVMLAVEKQHALAEKVQRALRIRQLELGVEPRSVQSLDDFFNAIIVRGLLSYNRILVAEATTLGVIAQDEPPQWQTLLRVCADEARLWADDLRVFSADALDPIEIGAASIYLLQAAAHLKAAAEGCIPADEAPAPVAEIGENGRPVSRQDATPPKQGNGRVKGSNA